MLQFATTKLMAIRRVLSWMEWWEFHTNHRPSTIDHTPLRVSHHILTWYRTSDYTLFLQPDMELELEHSLVFGQKHSEKSTDLNSFGGFLCALDSLIARFQQQKSRQPRRSMIWRSQAGKGLHEFIETRRMGFIIWIIDCCSENNSDLSCKQALPI